MWEVAPLDLTRRYLWIVHALRDLGSVVGALVHVLGLLDAPGDINLVSLELACEPLHALTEVVVVVHEAVDLLATAGHFLDTTEK